MSGGHWNYQQKHLDNYIEDLPRIIQAVQDCFNIADLVICGDSSEEKGKDEIFKRIVQLGDDVYGC